MADVSAIGITAYIKFSNTFPEGFPITSWADDTDPFDQPALDIATATMNVNGELVTTSTPTPLAPTIALIPGSEDDLNMQVALEANRPARGKRLARDIVTLTITYPDGSTATYTDGVMTGGMPIKSVASAGRIKSSTYAFAFENKSSTNATD